MNLVKMTITLKAFLKSFSLLVIATLLLSYQKVQATPDFRMTTLVPVTTKVDTKSCRSILGGVPDVGIASLDLDKPLGAHGDYVALTRTNSYRVGGFGGLGSMGYTKSDTYISAYQWRRSPIPFYNQSERPTEQAQALEEFFNFWRSLEKGPDHIREIENLEAQHDWRRSTLVTYTIDGTTIGGARVFDGQEHLNILDVDGGIRTQVNLGDSDVKLPMEVRFPEIEISGRKIELGLLTSRNEVDRSLPAMHFKIAQHLAWTYGKSDLQQVQTQTPLWRESSETGHGNLTPHSQSISQIYRQPEPVNYSEMLTYTKLVPNPEASIEALQDLYLYFIASPRITRMHQRNINGVEIIQTIATEESGMRNVLRVSAADFVNQFYFNYSVDAPTMNSRAENIDAYQRARIRERRAAVEEARFQRIYRERQIEILKGYDPEAILGVDYDVTIYGDVLDPTSALTTYILPTWKTRHLYYDNSSHEKLGQSLDAFLDEQ